MKKSVLLLALFLPPAFGGSPTERNPFVDMMRSMLDMFEAMQSYQKFESGSPPPPPTGPLPAPATSATLPSFGPQSIRELEGNWASNNRLLLAIHGDLGRLYWDRDRFRDFKLELLPPRLRMTDQTSGQSEVFELSMQGDKLVLRDSKGRLALFRRIPATRGAPTPAAK